MAADSVPRSIDAHAHLTDERFAEDLGAVIDRASAAGTIRILTCGEDIDSSERAVDLARRDERLRAAVGIHPHRTATCDERTLDRLRELARAQRVVAIGEIGIDLSGRSAPRLDQERAFAAQVALARELGMPVCVHVRDAGDIARAIIGHAGRLPGYVHCYSETRREVEAWMELGFHLSFSGTVTYPKNDELRAAAAVVPEDRLLLETDAPYLAPQGHRGRRNEPAFVAETYACVARVRGISASALAERVRRNAEALFGPRW